MPNLLFLSLYSTLMQTKRKETCGGRAYIFIRPILHFALARCYILHSYKYARYPMCSSSDNRGY